MAGQLDEARTHAEAARAISVHCRTRGCRATCSTRWRGPTDRDEPTVALEATQLCVDLMRVGLAKGGGLIGVYGMLAGLRFRTGDVDDAIGLLREAVLARDVGARPQLAAALDWSLSPLVKIGRPAPAARLVGALDDGALADVGNWPLSAGTRPRTLDRVRAALGDDVTDQLVAEGATMGYDEIIQAALDQLSHRPESPPKRRQNVRTECSRQYALGAQNGASVRSS